MVLRKGCYSMGYVSDYSEFMDGYVVVKFFVLSCSCTYIYCLFGSVIFIERCHKVLSLFVFL